MGQLASLDSFIESAVGFDLPTWPGGWPGEIEAALIDAVFSVRARYGGPTTGVRAVVNNWRQREGNRGAADDLAVLAATEPTKFAGVVKNSARASGRLKAEIVVDAAHKLNAAGLRHADQLTNSAEQKRAYLSVKGCGPVTWSYFGMLLGKPDVKADTWILRFVETAIGTTVTPEDARQLIVAVAKERGLDATRLDHAIWTYARGNL